MVKPDDSQPTSLRFSSVLVHLPPPPTSTLQLLYDNKLNASASITCFILNYFFYLALKCCLYSRSHCVTKMLREKKRLLLLERIAFCKFFFKVLCICLRPALTFRNASLTLLFLICSLPWRALPQWRRRLSETKPWSPCERSPRSTPQSTWRSTSSPW